MPTRQELIAKVIAMLLDGDSGNLVGGLLSVFGTAATALATAALKVLHSMSRNVGRLNANIEIVVKRTDDHTATLTDHEARLRLAEELRKRDEELAS